LELDGAYVLQSEPGVDIEGQGLSLPVPLFRGSQDVLHSTRYSSIDCGIRMIASDHRVPPYSDMKRTGVAVEH
jgi:hypothetical protein